MSKLYDFSVVICGWGDTPDEAWSNAKDNYDIDKELLPEYELAEDYEDE